MKDGENGLLAQAAADATAKANKALEDAQKYADQAEADAIASANGYTDGEIDKVEAAIKDVIDGTTPVAKATDADKLGNVAAADYALKTYVDQAEADALKDAKAYTDEVKKAILTGDSTTELKAAYDTLVEIQEWIEDAGVNATELTEAIAAEAKLRKEEDGRLAGLIADEVKDREDAVKGVQDQIDALGIKDGKVDAAAKADVASSLDEAGIAQVKGIKVDDAAHANLADKATLADAASSLDAAGVEQVKGIKVNNAGHANTADAATKATQDGNGLVIADTYETKTDAAQKLADAKSYADGLIAGLDVEDSAVAGKYVSAVNEVDGKVVVSRADLPTYSVTPGTTNGTVAFNGSDVAVTGLKSAAYTDATDYATAAQGALADSALQKADITTGSANGTIAVEGTDVAVAGLKSAAYTEASDYATAAQGAKADTALQAVEVGTGLTVTEKADSKQTIDIDETVIFVLNGGSASTVI